MAVFKVMTIFKMKHVTHGGHVHLSLFTSSNRPGATWAKCGDLCVRVEEFDDLKRAMAGVTFEPLGAQQ